MTATACDDNPFAFNWDDIPDTVLLYSMARPELGLVSAYAFFDGVELEVEVPGATGQWDIAIDTRGGKIVMLPPQAWNLHGCRDRDVRKHAARRCDGSPSDSLEYVSDQAVTVEFECLRDQDELSLGSFKAVVATLS